MSHTLSPAPTVEHLSPLSQTFSGLPVRRSVRVLALDPSSKGVGFAIMEGPKRLIDWGLKSAKTDQSARSLEQITALVDHYQPQVLVIEDLMAPDSRRCPRVQHLLARIAFLAHERDMEVYPVSRSQVRDTFCLFTKYEIAQDISSFLPELSAYLPPKRKIWLPEDERMNIFDAVSFALTYFFNKMK